MDFNETKFRDFLKQIKFDIYLDFVHLCQHIMSPDPDISNKLIHIKELCKYLESRPKGKNLAFCNQINRKALLNYCQNYELGQKIDTKLFHASLKYAQGKIFEKKAVFDKVYKI